MKLSSSYLFTGILGALLLAGCSEEETVPQKAVVTPATAQFQQDAWQVSEKGGVADVVINLSKPAPAAGAISVQLGGTHLSHVTTQPALVNGIIALPVARGTSSASFRIQTVDNGTMDGNKLIALQLAQVSEGLQVGTLKSAQVGIEDDEAPVTAAFLLNAGSVRENSSEGSTVVIALGSEAPANGQLVIAFNALNAQPGTDFQTEPALINNHVVLPIQAGTRQATFKILPVNNAQIDNHREIRMSIESAAGGVRKGDQLTFSLTVTDDEVGFTKSYHTSAPSGWSSSRFYQYNLDGTIARILWQNDTPGRTTGEYLYEYENGRVSRVQEHPGRYSTFTWENNLIVKQETFVNGTLSQYNLYGYDAAGHVGEVAVHYRQPNGEMKLSLIFVYLYFNNGNVYKKMVYNPGDGGEPTLVETHTYDNYLAVENPFPMVEILPNVNSQPALPTSYKFEAHERTIEYQLVYQFGANGLPTQRTVSWPGGTETATFQYYE